MSERKAYRVEIRNLMLGQVSATNATDRPDALLIPWPEDCPWDIEDFPLPDTEVLHESGNPMFVIGPPEDDRDGEWWVPVYGWTGRPGFEMARNIPSIWNARKHAKNERVVGELTISEGNYMSLRSKRPPLYSGVHQRIMHSPLPEGKYDIIRREEP